MPRILITGARGFLARALHEELRRRFPGARFTLSDNRPARGQVPCELLDIGSVNRLVFRTRPSLVFHMAGTTRPSDWENLWLTHVTATVNLLDALRLTGIPGIRFVLPSSSAEYGAAHGRVRESAPRNPITLYGSTKLAQSLTAMTYRHRGLKVSAARIFNVMGPGMPEHLALGTFARQIALIERGRQAPRILVGNLAARRDYLDVRDVARALADIARIAPGVYNICSGRSRPLAALLKSMLALSPVKIKIVRDPKRFRKSEVLDIYGSHARLTRASGWRPRVALSQSLKETLAWHRRGS